LTLLQLIVLAVVQGLTEFLPVSSSAHLILVSWFMHWPDQGLVTDVAIHFGTLFAVLLYFRGDLANMLRAVIRPQADAATAQNRRLLGFLALASVPVILVGGLAHGWVEAHLRDVRVIAISTLVFGLALWLVDARCARQRVLSDLGLRHALWIGLAQVLALVPGASRAGVTLTMGRLLGFDAVSAARFSFLLAIPVLAAAGGFGMLQVVAGDSTLDWGGFALAVVFAALAGWICIAAFLALLERFGLLPFVIYRLVLGVVLLYVSFAPL
jgi:undecaprenyl-diphosphatase